MSRWWTTSPSMTAGPATGAPRCGACCSVLSFSLWVFLSYTIAFKPAPARPERLGSLCNMPVQPALPNAGCHASHASVVPAV